MPLVALSGTDTIKINDRVFAGLADADVAVLTYPNEIAVVKTGKNGNSIYSLNTTGNQAELKVKVLRGSADDKFLNALLSQQQADNNSSGFAGFILLSAELVKKIGDGKGNITADTYICSGGVFTKLVEAKSNVEGDTEQATSMYTIKFSNAPRSIA